MQIEAEDASSIRIQKRKWYISSWLLTRNKIDDVELKGKRETRSQCRFFAMRKHQLHFLQIIENLFWSNVIKWKRIFFASVIMTIKMTSEHNGNEWRSEISGWLFCGFSARKLLGSAVKFHAKMCNWFLNRLTFNWWRLHDVNYAF